MTQLSLFGQSQPTQPQPRTVLPAHTCHAEGCTVPVSPTMLMCGKHWFQVPKNLQREVWRHYRPGQEEDKCPSPEYLKASRAAIDSLKPKPEPSSTEIQIDDRVRIVGTLSGKRDFAPWKGRTGIYRGIASNGLALVDFGVPNHSYPVNPSWIEKHAYP